VQLGIGARYFLGENRAITLKYRWLHLSDTGMKLPKNGANTERLYAGLSWLHERNLEERELK
jgi:opacity protein-like surface antigen